MMSSRVIMSFIVVLLAFLAISEEMSLGAEMHCRCIRTEKNRIGPLENVERFPANSHCEQTEIIATKKKTGEKVCLDPEAQWVKIMIKRIMAKSSRRR